MAGVTRRGVLAGLAATGAGPGSARAAPRSPTESMPLRDHAARAGLIYGAAITVEGLGDPICRPLYEAETQLVTTDLEFKFWSLRPTPDTWDFSGADTIVSWASAKNKLVRAHTLIWNESNPDWLKRCSAREIARIFDEHIERVVSRYAGRIHVWDVINEPCWPDHGKPRGLRQGPWYDALGADYIARALKRVRALDPHAELCINEGGCEETTGWGAQIRPAFERLIVDLRGQDVPFDVVGLQAHLRPDKPYDDARYVEFLHRIAATGVDLHITEFDVYDGSFPDGIVTRDRLVAERAAAYLKAALSVPAVKMVVNWELVDSSSFYVREDLARNPGALRLPRPLPFDSVGRRKPLWHAMAAAFDARGA